MLHRANELFESGLNCAQSVFAAYAPKFGLDELTAMRIASAFGGGMGRLASVCGAVTGAFMTIGLKYGDKDPESKERTYSMVREFAERFKSMNSSIYCRELLGYDVSKKEDLEIARQKNLFKTICPKFVKASCEILENLLERDAKDKNPTSYT